MKTAYIALLTTAFNAAVTNITAAKDALRLARKNVVASYTEAWNNAKAAGVTPAEFKAALEKIVTAAGYVDGKKYAQEMCRLVDKEVFKIRNTAGRNTTKVIRLTDSKKKAFAEMALTLHLTPQQIEALLLTLSGEGE